MSSTKSTFIPSFTLACSELQISSSCISRPSVHFTSTFTSPPNFLQSSISFHRFFKNNTSFSFPKYSHAIAMSAKTQAHEVFMPALSSTMTEGKIVQWLKKEGDKVQVGDVIMVVESDKADMDVESFEEGYLASILVPEGSTAAVGQTLALLAENKADVDIVKKNGISSSPASASSPTPASAQASAHAPAPAPAPAPASAPLAAAAQKPDSVGEVFMPALSSTMTEGKIVQWLKKEGDKINAGDVMMVVESDKADMDVESFEDGYLALIVCPEGSQQAVGKPIAYLAESPDKIPIVKAWALSRGTEDQNSTQHVTSPSVSPPAAAPSAPRLSLAVVNTGRIIASPYAKKVAQEHSVDLAFVKGTGPQGSIQATDVKNLAACGSAVPPNGRVFVTPEAKKIAEAERIDVKNIKGTGNFGRVIAEDVLKAAGKWTEPKKAVPGAPAGGAENAEKKATQKADIPGGAVAMNVMQKAVVKNMNASLSVPIFRVSYNITTTKLDEFYAKTKPKGVTVSAILAKAVAHVLTKHPVINARYENDSIVYNQNFNIAMAVALKDGGLITPTLKNPHESDIYSVSRSWKVLVGRAMEKKLSPDEYNSGTFTISNLGMYGVDSFDAILPPNQGSILAIAASEPQVKLQANGLVGVSKVMKVNITCDHRHIYGAQAAEFLRDLKDLLENNIEQLLY